MKINDGINQLEWQRKKKLWACGESQRLGDNCCYSGMKGRGPRL